MCKMHIVCLHNTTITYETDMVSHKRKNNNIYNFFL